MYAPYGKYIPTVEEFTNKLNNCLETSSLWIDGDYDLGYPHIILICKALQHPLCKWDTLMLRDCDIDDSKLFDILNALYTNKTVKTIDFRYNNISDLGCKHINDFSKEKNGLHICLNDNDITITGAILNVNTRNNGISIYDGCNHFNSEDVENLS